ncbi:aminotransferase class IV [Desulfovibrio ferrophilus]|uniref:Aminotransferase class IV n=1 Tax=Desulfovibrio ferrophilus TaxID=241368 RepID=A0A2Z6AXR2_9BACT|nr:aminotransferase class IV [Desulfovibrio ferrophilus]BBD08052.1 aminotransferase class IV [Desulfovibrio ferrophilus]
MIFYRNGEYHKDRIDLSVTSPALRYGFGFFETLYWDGGRVCRLEAHQKRIFSSLKAFDLDYVDENFATIIPQVAHDNGLSGQTARINIQYPIDDTGPAQAIVMAAPYSPPDKPLRLVLTPRPFHSWLGLHKSTSHLPYFLEHKKALAAGMNGAVLAAPSGHVLEVTHAALLFQDGNTLLTPAPPLQGEQAPGILPSTALAAASETLEITARPVRVDEIGNFKCAWALNSLMGMQPIAAIGQNTFTLDDETAKAITTVIHGS